MVAVHEHELHEALDQVVESGEQCVAYRQELQSNTAPDESWLETTAEPLYKLSQLTFAARTLETNVNVSSFVVTLFPATERNEFESADATE